MELNAVMSSSLQNSYYKIKFILQICKNKEITPLCFKLDYLIHKNIYKINFTITSNGNLQETFQNHSDFLQTCNSFGTET